VHRASPSLSKGAYPLSSLDSDAKAWYLLLPPPPENPMTLVPYEWLGRRSVFLPGPGTFPQDPETLHERAVKDVLWEASRPNAQAFCETSAVSIQPATSRGAFRPGKMAPLSFKLPTNFLGSLLSARIDESALYHVLVHRCRTNSDNSREIHGLILVLPVLPTYSGAPVHLVSCASLRFKCVDISSFRSVKCK